MFCCCFRKKKQKEKLTIDTNFRICSFPDIEHAFADYTYTHAQSTYGTLPEKETKYEKLNN